MAEFHEGVVLPSLTKPPVTKTQLVMYSGASEDFNPIHTVDEFAVEAGLGGVIAHGMLSMAFIGQMLTDCLGEQGMLVDFGVRFQGMVRPGDTITCGGTVKKVIPEKTRGRVFADVWAENQKGERVITGDAEFTVKANTTGTNTRESNVFNVTPRDNELGGSSRVVEGGEA